jgi:RNA polymerase-binding transcription factor DksA
MAIKKQPPKKAAKPVKTAKKAPAKATRPAAVKPVAKKAAQKTAVKKPASKKVAVAAKKPVKKNTPAPKKAVKPAPKAVKSVAKPKQAPIAAPAKKQAEPPKKAVPARPAAKTVEPVKKPAVAAPTHHEVKPAIKPLEKQAPKKDPPKPTKVVIPKTSTTRSVKYDPDFTRSVLDSHSQQHVQTGPTMRYSDVELAEFKDLILKKLDTAKKELAYLQGLITRKDEGDMEDGRYMTMEDGSMSMEREQLSQMASRQIQFIDHLEKAIMRIENKTYGICRVTGKLIDKARLRAVPHATLSIEAKQMMNK